MKVQLSGVSKVFGSHRALNKVWLEVQPGAIMAILGANGAGKSTLLHLLSGLLSPDEGLIEYDDQQFKRTRLDLRRKIYFLPDFPVFFPGQTVLQNLATVLRFYEIERAGLEEETIQLFEKFEILSYANAGHQILSRGQAYKAALIPLLLTRPELWLLDEPMASGMDPAGLRFFRASAGAAAKNGATILYTTQLPEVAEQFADRIAILHKTELIECDTLSNLKTKHGAETLEEVLIQIQEPGR